MFVYTGSKTKSKRDYFRRESESACLWKFEVWVLPQSVKSCKYGSPSDLKGRSQSSYTVPCNVVVSHGAKIGGLQVFADHTRKNKRKKKCTHNLCAPCDVLCMFIFILQMTCAVHIAHMMNHGYFDYGKNPNHPQFEPHAGLKTVQVWGSPLYIGGFTTDLFISLEWACALFWFLATTCDMCQTF